MRTQDEVVRQIEILRNELVKIMEDHETAAGSEKAELELLILSLVDKLEVLLWVVETDIDINCSQNPKPYLS